MSVPAPAFEVRSSVGHTSQKPKLHWAFWVEKCNRYNKCNNNNAHTQGLGVESRPLSKSTSIVGGLDPSHFCTFRPSNFYKSLISPLLQRSSTTLEAKCAHLNLRSPTTL